MTILTVAALAALAIQAEDNPRKPPKEPERPFTVSVQASPKGEERVVKGILEARAELEKKLRKNEKWFRVSEVPDEAEIVVELVAFFKRPASGGFRRGNVFETLRARVKFFGETRIINGLNSSRNGAAFKQTARHLADQLTSYCKDHYWKLADRRQR